MCSYAHLEISYTIFSIVKERCEVFHVRLQRSAFFALILGTKKLFSDDFAPIFKSCIRIVTGRNFTII